MKYIICGLEHVGLRVTESLLELKEEVTLITLNRNEPCVFIVRDRISNYIEGDARSINTLKQAGIDEADYFLIFTSNEIKNIEINCKAKEVNPDIKTALLIQNSSYSRIVEQGFEANRVFHLPSIVSFPITSACINRNILFAINRNNNSFYIGCLKCNELNLLWNRDIKEIENEYKIKIISNLKTDNNKTSDVISEGDTLIYMTSDDLHFEKNVLSSKSTDIEFVSEKSRSIFFKLFSISRGIKKVITLYTLLIFLSVVIFKIALKLSIIDALYFVITTTTTVGYGDFNFQNAPLAIKIYGCFIMIAGAALLATLFSVLTDNIISKRFGRYVNSFSRKLKNHIIVAGTGSIGIGVINNLIENGIKMVVIEKNPDNSNIQSLQNKVPVLIGDASDQNILMKAGIKKAKALAALIDDDLNNISIILKGNSLNNNLHTVARIFSHELHQKAKNTFNIDNVLSASGIAVPYIICNLIHKDVIWAGYINKEIYCILKLTGINHFNNKGRKNIIESHDLVPFMIERNESIIELDDTTVIKNEDKIFLFGSYEALKREFARI